MSILLTSILLAIILKDSFSAEITCPRPDSKGISTFNIRADSPLGELNFIQIQYDMKRHLVVTSTTLIDDLNKQKPAHRLEPFRPYECIPAPGEQPNCSVAFSMTAKQQAKSGRHAWDRGHLTPANPMRFSEDALNSTFYCINIAPQESFTNQNPWKDVELSSENKLETTTGIVMTGVCSANNTVDGPVTYRGWVIPACFWKLVCYLDPSSNLTQVVGFIADNSLINVEDEEGKAERTTSVTTPKAQSEIIKLMSNSKIITQGWTKAFKALTPGRETDRLPTSLQCIRAKNLSKEIADDWKNFIANN